MGRLIEADELLKYGACPNNCKGTPTCMKDDYEHLHCPIRVFDIESINDAPTVEAIPKDQYEQRLKENNELINDLEELRTMINKFAESYENRLKADMVAMLEEIQLEIQEIWDKDPSYLKGLHDSEMVIQQKIDKLKEAD